MTPFSPRARAAAYARLQSPTHAIVIPSPWWFAVLGLDCGVANIGEPHDLRGPLAIIAGYSSRFDNTRDVAAMLKIWKAQGGYFADVYRQPWERRAAADKFVGVVTAHGRMEDHDAEGLWFDGPAAIRTTDPVLLGSPWRVETPLTVGQQVVELTERDRLNFTQALFQRAAMPD